MSRTVRALAFLCGALWFFPVSCTTGLVATVPLLSKFHERHMEKGDAPHSTFFYVVWQPGEAGKPFGYSKLAALAPDKTPPARSFIMEPPSGRIEEGKFTIVTYKVLSSGVSEQLIEVAWANDDYGSVSRYRATRSSVTPVFSRIMGPEFMFMAFPIALGFAAAIYAVGRWLRRRVARAQAD